MIRFTKEEKIALLFLLAAFFIGTCVLHFKRENPSLFETIEAKRTVININKAEIKELMEVEGIGPVLAARIVSYRKRHGPFESKKEIENVKGIGRKTFEKIKDNITLE